MLVDTVRDDLPFILSVGTGCAISASCLEKRKHFYLRVALTLLLTFGWMYSTRQYVGLGNIQGTRMGMVRYIVVFVLFLLSVPFCSRANFCQSLYAVTVAYSIQNMCERLIQIPRYSLDNFPVLLDRSCLVVMMAIALYIYYRILVGKHRQRTVMDFSNMSSCMMLFMGVGVLAITVVLDLTLYRVTPSGNTTLSNCAKPTSPRRCCTASSGATSRSGRFTRPSTSNATIFATKSPQWVKRAIRTS